MKQGERIKVKVLTDQPLIMGITTLILKKKKMLNSLFLL